MVNAVIYTKPSCPYCTEAKRILSENNIIFNELIIGSDLVTEEFSEIYPEQKTVPLILINGEKIGGYTQLVEWIRNRPQFLAE